MTNRKYNSLLFLSKLMTQFALLIICITLAGCGFHLRGQETLPPVLHNVYIKSTNPRGPLARQLGLSLRQLGANTTKTPAPAQVIIQITNESFSNMVTAFGSNSQISQLLVTYSVQFEMTDNHGNLLIPTRKVSTSAPYAQNYNAMLSVGTDLNVLEQQMRQDVVQQIILQLTAVNIHEIYQPSPYHTAPYPS